MHDGLPFLIVVTVVAAVLGSWAYAVYFSAKARSKRALRRQKLQHIGRARDGEVVKVEGCVSFLEPPMEAPLSGRPCAIWEVVIEEHRGKQGWRQVIRDFECRSFVIDDGTGQAEIHAVIPQLALVDDAHFHSETFHDATPALERFLNRHRQQSTGLLGFNRNLRYREGVIEAGERVAVMGLGRWEASPDGRMTGGYRGTPRRLVIEDPEDGHAVISDDPAALGK